MDKTNDFMQDKLNALVDGQLTAEQQAEALAQVAGDPAAQDTLQAWQAQREALRALHRPLLEEPIPATLLAAAQRGRQGRQQLDQWWRWGGMAAAVMLAFGVGWLAHGRLGQPAAQQLAAANPAAAAQAFVHQASLAYAVYSPEVRHPVEVDAAQQEHLVQWLSKRLGRPLKVPLLASQGYELVGGRLLPGEGSARAQFMFQNAAGLRVTLYLGAVDAPQAAGAAHNKDTKETAFRYSMNGPVPSFYWVDQGFGYALSGALSRDELMRLAELVYQQL
ncbi:anti-sigma factor family protein [Polaromonas sp. UC242_47]|uniref:anti-sigma factor family protein n=1 Tax=Polaromonas sp. UC242_47 TaxID=3374626 RepID=UPI0037A6947E